MTYKKTAFFYLLIFHLSVVGKAQKPMTDSVLTLRDFLQLIAANHPSVKQANLLNRAAEAELLTAKGGFDPKVYGDFEQKFFKKKTYFNVGEGGVKVPTWYGVEVKTAYSYVGGNFINPSEVTPSAGLGLVGVSVPLLQGFTIDDRRANLFKARQTQLLNANERAILLNDLAFSATQVYWKWVFYFENRRIFQEALRLAEARFTATKTAFEQGDRMAMDTLESFIQVQDRQVQLNEAELDVQEAQLKLTNFLWNNQNKPSNFSDNWTAQMPTINPNTEGVKNRAILLENIAETHPFLKIYDAKLAQLNIDQRLKKEKLKPKLNANYNILSNGLAFNPLFTDNYKWGISFSSSTLFRAEKGEVQLAKIKIENTQLLREQKALELRNKLQFALNELDNALLQLDLFTKTVDNYRQLLILENNRFQLGESSLFLLNSREMKLIEAQIKLVKAQIAVNTARASIDWAAGTLEF
ncbi:MAG: TolC family protein [Saprospiraceae bacterium]|nr:TolC family protein [Saprospiraceae bacterium]